MHKSVFYLSKFGDEEEMSAEELCLVFVAIFGFSTVEVLKKFLPPKMRWIANTYRLKKSDLFDVVKQTNYPQELIFLSERGSIFAQKRIEYPVFIQKPSKGKEIGRIVHDLATQQIVIMFLESYQVDDIISDRSFGCYDLRFNRNPDAIINLNKWDMSFCGDHDTYHSYCFGKYAIETELSPKSGTELDAVLENVLFDLDLDNYGKSFWFFLNKNVRDRYRSAADRAIYKFVKTFSDERCHLAFDDRQDMIESYKSRIVFLHHIDMLHAI